MAQGIKMAQIINTIYRPITATPYRSNDEYVEIAPCAALRPYIRCFWGTNEKFISSVSDVTQSTLVIPDTCVDIVINLNFTDNKFSSHLCGINNEPFISNTKADSAPKSTFAIRFYAWSFVLFSDNDMKGSLNLFSDISRYVNNFKVQLEERMISCKNIYDRIKIAEKFLAERINISRENPDVMNSIYYIMKNQGSVTVKALSEYCAISKRQLERLFLANIGVTPKQMSGLIRYQNLWQDILKPNFDIQNAVFKYGFFDQSHLLNEFKRYHGMTVTQAKKLALAF